MTTFAPLPDWKRDYHQASDNSAFLFYVVYGADTEKLTLSRSKYRCSGIPDEIEILSYGPEMLPEVVESFRSGYVWEELQATAPKLANLIRAQTGCVIVHGTFEDAPTLNYFRDTIGLVTCLLDHDGVAVYDLQKLEWWSPSDWKAKVFDPAQPVPWRHVVVLVSTEDDGNLWLHTRGMRKFGRPDLSMHNVTPADQNAVVDMFNRFIEFQALGGQIQEGQQVRVNEFPYSWVCVHGGDEDDLDFNNCHVEFKR